MLRPYRIYAFNNFIFLFYDGFEGETLETIYN